MWALLEIPKEVNGVGVIYSLNMDVETTNNWETITITESNIYKVKDTDGNDVVVDSLTDDEILEYYKSIPLKK